MIIRLDVTFFAALALEPQHRRGQPVTARKHF
jgi:hypothetical protein